MPRKVTKQLWLSLTLILLTIPYNLFATTIKGNHSMLQNKPAFFINIKAENAVGEVMLNRNNMYKLEKRPVQTRIPVNAYIASEAVNELAIGVLFGNREKRTHDPDTYVELTLQFADMSQDSPKYYEIATLIFSGKTAQVGNPLALNSGEFKLNSNRDFMHDPQSGDIVVGPATELSSKDVLHFVGREFSLPKTALPKWGWMDGDDLTKLDGFFIAAHMAKSHQDEYNTIKAELLKEYQLIWNAINTGSFKSIMPAFSERNHEYDSAYGRAAGSTESKLVSAIEDSRKDSSKKLAPIDSDKIHAHIQDNNKLVWLKTYSGMSPIQFDWEDGGYEEYPIYFYRKNGKWIISR